MSDLKQALIDLSKMAEEEFDEEAEAEQAYENFLSSYYGGSQPMTLREQQDEALNIKAGLR